MLNLGLDEICTTPSSAKYLIGRLIGDRQRYRLVKRLGTAVWEMFS